MVQVADQADPDPQLIVPELAGVGRTERELERNGVEYLSASAPYSSATKGRAAARNQKQGATHGV